MAPGYICCVYEKATNMFYRAQYGEMAEVSQWAHAEAALPPVGLDTGQYGIE